MGIKTRDMRVGFYTSRSKSFDRREELLSRQDMSEPQARHIPSFETVVSNEKVQRPTRPHTGNSKAHSRLHIRISDSGSAALRHTMVSA